MIAVKNGVSLALQEVFAQMLAARTMAITHDLKLTNERDFLELHLEAYMARQNAQLNEAIAAALADLRHICDASGLDFLHLDALGFSHYCEEGGQQ